MERFLSTRLLFTSNILPLRPEINATIFFQYPMCKQQLRRFMDPEVSPHNKMDAWPLLRAESC